MRTLEVEVVCEFNSWRGTNVSRPPPVLRVAQVHRSDVDLSQFLDLMHLHRKGTTRSLGKSRQDVKHVMEKITSWYKSGLWLGSAVQLARDIPAMAFAAFARKMHGG